MRERVWTFLGSCVEHWWLTIAVVLVLYGALAGGDRKASDGGRQVECWEVDIAACPGYQELPPLMP